MRSLYQQNTRWSSVFFFSKLRMIKMILLQVIFLLSCSFIIAIIGTKSSPNRTDIMIIISRFEEGVDHLSWLKDYPHIIYNRGPAIVPPDSNASDASLHSLRTVDVLDNVGRESFIYLSHIVHRYHKLHEINIFSQAEQRVPTVPSYDDNCFKKDVEDLVVIHILSAIIALKRSIYNIISMCFKICYMIKFTDMYTHT